MGLSGSKGASRFQHLTNVPQGKQNLELNVSRDEKGNAQNVFQITEGYGDNKKVLSESYDLKDVYLYSLAFRDITSNGKTFTQIRLTFIDFESRESFIVGAYPNMYTTDNLLNRLSTLTVEQLQKRMTISVGKKSDPIRDEEGKLVLNAEGKKQYELVLNNKGLTVPKIDVKLHNDEPDAEYPVTYLSSALWEKETCEHPKAAEYKMMKDVARETSTGSGVNLFFRKLVTEHLLSIGFNVYNSEGVNYEQENFGNPVTNTMLDSFNESIVNNTSDATQNAAAVATPTPATATTPAPAMAAVGANTDAPSSSEDDLPF